MKFKVILVLVILFGMASTNCMAQDAASFEDLLRAGQTHQEAGRYAEARAAYEKALAVEGVTPDQTGRALVRIGEALIKEKKIQDGVASLQKARAMKDISNPIRIEANLLFGEAYLAYPWVLDQSRDAFNEVLNLPEATSEQKTAARKGLVRAFMGLRQFGDARSMMLALAFDANLTPAERLTNRISIGTTCLLEGMHAEARTELKKALDMGSASNAQKADIQLKIALSYYEAGDNERARPELEKLLTMPGADQPPFRSDGFGNSVASPMRAAKLRLLKMQPGDQKKETLAVLFIGSSMTIRGYMPLNVEELASSAPAKQPRIMAGMYVRGGTEISTFWNNGETRDTARGMINAGPWDVVVLETFCRISREDLLKYGKLFADFNRTRKLRTVFYESQPPQAVPYPEDALKYHETNVELGKTTNAAVAPVLLAEMRYLEAVPTAKREEFYDDWVHPSNKGRYMAVCCIYSAITGYSPVGLHHPEGISEEDARALQEAAWKAVQETNPALNAAERLTTQKSIAKTCMLEGKFPEARAAWLKVLGMEGLSDADKADIQLQIALSYYEAGDYARARPELEKVLTMPGANETQERSGGWLNYVPSHEAKLRLLKMEPDESEKTIAVLFIGSSMTLRGYMPSLVARLSKSAPAGRPRIMSAMYARGGIDIDTFWNDGDTRDTARGKVASVPWDAVVLETWHEMEREDLLKYGKLFADLAWSRKVEPVFYEAHPAQASPYPDEARAFHERTVELGKVLKAPVAPVALAEMYYVEAVPSAERTMFYADWVHPSEKGYSLAAYCIYAAITGYSPVGLAHPDSMSAEEAKAMQEAAWKAVRETNPNLKPLK